MKDTKKGFIILYIDLFIMTLNIEYKEINVSKVFKNDLNFFGNDDI